jgi:hypothetical protein
MCIQIYNLTISNGFLDILVGMTKGELAASLQYGC